MLIQLAIRDIVLIDKLELHFHEGLSVLTGETGRRQVDPARRLRPGARRARRRQPRPPRRDAGPGHGRVRLPVGPSGPPHRRGGRYRHRGRPDPAPRAGRGRAHPRLRQRPARQRPGAQGHRRGPRRDPRPARRPGPGRSRRPTARSSTPSAGSSEEVQAVAEAARKVREARTALQDHRDRIDKARKEADFLRHAVEELTKLNPAGRRGGSPRRAPHRHDAVREGGPGAQRGLRGRRRPDFAGAACCRPPCASWSAAAPRRPASSIRASRPSTPPSSPSTRRARRWKTAIRATEYDPRELEQTEERLFALRAAARKYDVPADELAALRERFVEDVAAIDAGEEQLAGLERALERRPTPPT